MEYNDGLKEKNKNRVRFACLWNSAVGLQLGCVVISCLLCMSSYMSSDGLVEKFLDRHKNYNSELKMALFYASLMSALDSILGVLVSFLSVNVNNWVFLRLQIKAYIVWTLTRLCIFVIIFYSFVQCLRTFEEAFLKDAKDFKRVTVEKYLDDNVRETMDHVQRHYQCCGVEGLEDWKQVHVFESSMHEFAYDIPKSCCSADNCPTSSLVWADILGSKFKDGCLKKLLPDAKCWFTTSAIAVFIVCILTAVALVLSAFGLKDPRDDEEIEAHERLVMKPHVFDDEGWLEELNGFETVTVERGDR